MDTKPFPELEELRTQTHEALKKLAACCDGVVEDDSIGFNASHTTIGKQMAKETTLCDLDVIRGAHIVCHYGRQLGEDTVAKVRSLLFVVENEGRVHLAPHEEGETETPVPTYGHDQDKDDINIVESEGEDNEHKRNQSSPLSTITLTEEQNQAIDLIEDWMKDSDQEMFKLGGYAGTGKTTIIKTILERFRGKHCSRVSAFTGKACNVLQRKGIRAQTLHSLMYNCDVDPKTGAVSFFKRARLEDDPDLIIVDEASMISTDLFNDLRSFGPKLLFVGDPGQLEPVGDNPNLMLNPSFVLSKIHRQAELSPIIRLASEVRTTGKIGYQDYDEANGLVVKVKALKASEAVENDQIICAKNKTRMGMNEKLRIFKGYGANLMVPGEKLIILRNNQNWGVFNGMLVFVDEIIEDCHNHWKLRVKDETGTFHKLPVWKGPFLDPRLREQKNILIPRDHKGMQYVLADYGYAITCHKSQGSEWDKVLVFDEWMPPTIWDMNRWRYTAITRAAKKLTYLL